MNSKHVTIIGAEDWEGIYVDDKLVHWHDSLPFSEALYRFKQWGIDGVSLTHSWEELDRRWDYSGDLPTSLADYREQQRMWNMGQTAQEDWL